MGAEDCDFWLIKTDAAGNMEWNQTYGGTRYDYASSVVQTSDGGYALAGTTYSFGHGNNDFWLVKTDGSGNMEWTRFYGGEEHETAYSLVETPDGGFALAGNIDDYVTGDTDAWLVRTSAQGVPEFPSWTPVLIMLLAVVAVAVIYRRKLHK